MSQETVVVKLEIMYPDVVVPEYSHEGDSGMDVRAYFSDEWVLKTYGQAKVDYFRNQPNALRHVMIGNQERVIVPTGIKVAIPPGYEIQVRPRSGYAAKHGLTVLNTPGTIDCVPFNTNILTLDGEKKAIDLFNANDKISILSFNEENYCIEEDIISDAWIVPNHKLIEIETEGSLICIPPDKEVYTRRGWVKAADLSHSDEILSLN